MLESKLYKKGFLDNYNNFHFDENSDFSHVLFHVKSMIRAKMSFVNEFLYHFKLDDLNSINNESCNVFDVFNVINLVEDFLKSEGIFEEFKFEYTKFIIENVLERIIAADSQEYFAMSKEKFSMIGDKFLPENREKYDLVMNIDDYLEFKFELMKTLYKETNNRFNDELFKLNNENSNLRNNNSKLKKDNKKLKAKNKKLKKEIKKTKKLNEEILNSSSWKVTKPLRKLRRDIF